MQIAKDISEELKKSVSESTIWRVLHNSRCHRRRPGKKPFISKVNKAKCINYAKNYESKDINFWENVLFTDENKFEIFGGKKMKKIWRKKNKELAKQNNQCTVKQRRGSVMV